MLPVAVVAAFAITACGGGSDSSASSADASPTETSADATVDTSSETSAAEEADNTGDEADDGDVGGDGCDQVLTSDEVQSVLGTSVEFTGSGQVCTVVFANDSTGTLQAFSDSKADDALDTLLAGFLADEAASASGVLLDDGRGYVLENSAIVRGDSGRVFRFDAPDNLDIADIQGAMQSIADLLLTR